MFLSYKPHINNKSSKGVYFLIYNNDIVYIGKSNNIFLRISDHIEDKTKSFDNWFYLLYDVSDEILSEIEYEYIKKFNPILNLFSDFFNYVSKNVYYLYSKEYLLKNSYKAKIKGIYFLYRKNTIVYVGSSYNLYKRFNNHFYQKLKNFDSWGYIEFSKNVTKAELLEKEDFYINKYDPLYNKRGALNKKVIEYNKRREEKCGLLYNYLGLNQYLPIDKFNIYEMRYIRNIPIKYIVDNSNYSEGYIYRILKSLKNNIENEDKERKKEILTLHFINFKSFVEIASILNITSGYPGEVIKTYLIFNLLNKSMFDEIKNTTLKSNISFNLLKQYLKKSKT